tara:strand:+ start:52 stop:354 length:303 start_codon:yes stop_codon:yes gene_type:complete
MNRKMSKRIRHHSELLLVAWMKQLLEKEEADKITINTYKSFMPKQTHFMAQRTMYLNAYHPKWIAKKIKQLIKIFPDILIEDVNLEMITWKVNQRPINPL